MDQREAVPTIKPICCTNCGNYQHHVGSTRQEIPCSIRCWKKNTGDCHKDPRKATVAQMKVRSILIHNPDPTKECAICLNLMKSRYVKKIFCGHTFHPKCLKEWEEKKRSCPMCRFDYTPPLSHKDIIEDVEETIADFKHAYHIWIDLMIPMYRQYNHKLPEENDLEELKNAFDDVVDTYEEYIKAHNKYREHIHDIPPSSRTVNRYQWVCQITGPILVAINKIRTGTDGVCRDDIITHAFERIVFLQTENQNNV